MVSKRFLFQRGTPPGPSATIPVYNDYYGSAAGFFSAVWRDAPVFIAQILHNVRQRTTSQE